MMEVCDYLTLDSARHLSAGKEPFERHQKIRPLLCSLWVYMFYLFPSSVLRFLLCPSEMWTVPVHWNPLL